LAQVRSTIWSPGKKRGSAEQPEPEKRPAPFGPETVVPDVVVAERGGIWDDRVLHKGDLLLRSDPLVLAAPEALEPPVVQF